ncbi:hypothetical protein [Umezawaea sp. Da 62-37]|uniref:hypothetical protein n=1 Tax=Umezawaea sp. Da 62-37 TaxID=3075927 RepID=UPI0028F74C49|nr:hypothetical protein [Umezawaea sp. Da 62-37]WNV90167.1 hypothetical protein RM788_18280 [Umezawaea sp. Da 62-37]
MFFEPDPTAQDLVEPPEPPPTPPWLSPPAEEMGVIVPFQRVVFRGDSVVVVLSSARVYTTGCLLLTEVVARRGDMPLNEWWELRGIGHSTMFTGVTAEGGLPDKVLRFGVRLPDGTKATTLGGLRRAAAREVPPSGSTLTWTPVGGGGRSGGGMHLNHTVHGLWLWPLPPPEPLEFAVEWPFGGIDLTIVELDGRLITEAAGRSEPYWP